MSNSENYSRRDFVRNLTIGTGSLVFVGSVGVAFRVYGEEGRTVKGIVIDYTKCSGCRTCETVCSAFNHKEMIDGELMNGLGNPFHSNIKVYGFNPDVDVPMVCSLCEDAPCIAACPIPPDLFTGRKALYKHPETFSICNDDQRCVACGACARACKKMRTGIIHRNADGKPFGMCTLCQGNPQCVEYCTYDTLSLVELTDKIDFRKKSPEFIAEKLVNHFYDLQVKY